MNIYSAAAQSLQAAIADAIAAAQKQAAPFTPSHAQIAVELQPVVNNLLDLGKDAAVEILREYPTQIAGTWAQHVLAECKSAWSMEDVSE